MVGVASIAVPTSNTMILMANISMILFSISGASMEAIAVGILATAISQEVIIAAAHKNMTTLVVFAAATSTSPILAIFNSPYTYKPMNSA